ncbi:hypothetical protein BD626DRAFT_542078, partial [Schizophyllum amplum]
MAQCPSPFTLSPTLHRIWKTFPASTRDPVFAAFAASTAPHASCKTHSAAAPGIQKAPAITGSGITTATVSSTSSSTPTPPAACAPQHVGILVVNAPRRLRTIRRRRGRVSLAVVAFTVASGCGCVALDARCLSNAQDVTETSISLLPPASREEIIQRPRLHPHTRHTTTVLCAPTAGGMHENVRLDITKYVLPFVPLLPCITYHAKGDSLYLVTIDVTADASAICTAADRRVAITCQDTQSDQRRVRGTYRINSCLADAPKAISSARTATAPSPSVTMGDFPYTIGRICRLQPPILGAVVGRQLTCILRRLESLRFYSPRPRPRHRLPRFGLDLTVLISEMTSPPIHPSSPATLRPSIAASLDDV